MGAITGAPSPPGTVIQLIQTRRARILTNRYVTGLKESVLCGDVCDVLERETASDIEASSKGV